MEGELRGKYFIGQVAPLFVQSKYKIFFLICKWLRIRKPMPTIPEILVDFIAKFYYFESCFVNS